MNINEKLDEIREKVSNNKAFEFASTAGKRLCPKHKTLLTVVWIAISMMIGEIIIYNHQNIFHYITSASEFSDLKGANSASSSVAERKTYEKQVTSNANFYKNILSNYTKEDSVELSVKKEVEKPKDTGAGVITPNLKCAENALKANHNLNPRPNAIVNAQKPVSSANVKVARAASAGNTIEKLKVGANRESIDSVIKTRQVSRTNTQAARNNNLKFLVHHVKAGENLAKISKTYFKTEKRAKEIALNNNLKAPYQLRTGEKLIIMTK